MNKLIKAVIRLRVPVILLTLLITLAALLQLKTLSIIIDPDKALPQSHPFIVTNKIVEKAFGNKYTVVIDIHAEKGTIFQTGILNKVQVITKRLRDDPGVVKANLSSLAGRKSKAIVGDADGMTVHALMDKVPQNESEMLALRRAIASNPVYENFLVSKDEKTTQIIAEFHQGEGGMTTVRNTVQKVLEDQKDDTVSFSLGGGPIFLALLEDYSQRMTFLFPLALLVIGLIHYEAFRTVQALILPLVTALLAVIWSLGFLALTGQPFDVFNSSTPILILAIAAGHAVQILKRYYEEYNTLYRKEPNRNKKELSHLAVESSLSKVGPVMVVACTIAALGFLSLIIFEIRSIRTFGLFTAVGILSALVLELSFIPALRAMLPPPADKELQHESKHTFWDRLVEGFFELAYHKRRSVYLTSGILIVLFGIGASLVKVDNSQKAYYYGKIKERLDDDRINDAMAGTNPLYILVEGKEPDAIKDPKVLAAMDEVQGFLNKEALVGKTVSIVDFIKRMNQAMNEDRPEASTVPESRELVAQYLLLYSNSGEPGDFDNFVDYDYQRALITAFIKTERSSQLTEIIQRTEAFMKGKFGPNIKVSIGGGATAGTALNEVMIREKILNIVQIMGAVFLISSLVFRSFFAGVLILVPLIAAVLVNFGIMGILGIPLQIATALVSAMAVGIGADYGIYMSYRLREELAKGEDEQTALKKAYLSAGKATIFVSTAVAGGFGVLILSWGFMIHLWMGFLIALAMLVSSVAALTIFPALIFTFRPAFIFKERKTHEKTNIVPLPVSL